LGLFQLFSFIKAKQSVPAASKVQL
jgi:hypothetical protein